MTCGMSAPISFENFLKKNKMEETSARRPDISTLRGTARRIGLAFSAAGLAKGCPSTDWRA